MTLHIVVTAKQVLDPETPLSAFNVADNAVSTAGNIPPVVNGYDEQAVEAALRIKEAHGDAKVTVLSCGTDFALDVIKKPLAMGADELVLLQDAAFENSIDPTMAVAALTAAIRKLGDVDIVISGRQASDWDNAQVPLGVAESLGWAVATIGRKVDVQDGTARVERVLPDGHETVEAPLPAVVTVSNELGTPRYPNMRGIMAARRVQPTVWTVADLDLDGTASPAFELVSLKKPERAVQTEMIAGDDDADAGRKLALRLREERVL
ncbi:MAG: electron transfer flavoprotein subunit beta/FixA family protein [Chloroflexi bacterium]|nr:electron transfer flavoprotein subunit beta/FixA family protein [Chloroflexota bacterium]MYA51825.1 electron transfer flavoprotein subunit beta/FixA family protein [Chloroflexota bacterium]MYB85415.1 electron transfer flavoprotein subunit beta/FixA family protein [Chloroflexota bacterium]MYK35628.1 electron transfer flavoprotein subunit beta/FixA family protein [Chloroflexota bacterium]